MLVLDFVGLWLQFHSVKNGVQFRDVHRSRQLLSRDCEIVHKGFCDGLQLRVCYSL